MNKKITFRHMDHSDALEAHINKQLEKVVHFLQHEKEPIYLDIVLEPSKLHEHHRVEFRLKSPHYDLIAHYEHAGTEFYKAVDHVIDVMYRQLREEKERLLDKRKEASIREDFDK